MTRMSTPTQSHGSEAAVPERRAPTVTVVIPTHNEADNLPYVIPHLPAEVTEVIVVDGHSTDGTPEVALRLCPEALIIMQDRCGKGNAIACGLRAATGDAVVMLDADGSADPAEIPRFIEALNSGAEYVKGSRYLKDGGSSDLSRLRSVGNRALGGLVNVLFGTRYTDFCYGYNAFWRRLIPVIYRSCDGFEVEAVLTLRARRAKVAITEIPSFEHERIHGSSNLNTFKDGWRVLGAIVRERVGRSPRTPPPVPREVIKSGNGQHYLAERRRRQRGEGQVLET